MAGPYLSWSCSMADCQLRLSMLYGTMQVHYVITCSMYDYLAWIEVLRVVVSVLHLHVILQYQSSDSSVTVEVNWGELVWIPDCLWSLSSKLLIDSLVNLGLNS